MRTGNRIRCIALALAALGTVGIAGAQAKIEVGSSLKGNALVVKYRNAAAASVELIVNGQSVLTRAVASVEAAGETTLSLEGVRLTDGENRIEVRLYGADGKLLGVESTLLVVDRNPGAVAQLTSPKAGAAVQGPVQLTLDLKRELRGVYVSFFINGNLAAMKNFPPYNYLWDTTREVNGWHDLEAWVIDDANSTFKSNPVRVFVNNPGGRTDRRASMPAARAVAPAARVGAGGTANVKAMASAAVASAAARAAFAAVPAQVAKSAPALVAALGSLRAPIERGGGVKAASLPTSVPTGVRTLAPTGQRVAAAGGPNAAAVVTTPIRATAAAGNSVLRPTNPAIPRIASPSVAAANRVSSVGLTYGTRLRYSGTLSISLDGKPVLFDVEPTVRDGVALTPFRHLFEAAGGEVKWSGEDRTVSAEGAGGSVWLKIGAATARLDKLPVKLELAPYLDRGRTVVPLSFVRQALKVEVEVDPATGHVVITRVKN